MDPDQVYQWITTLPPELQQAMYQTFMGMGTGAPPMGEFQVNPYDPIAPSTAYNYVPELDKNGNVQPWDLTVAQKNLNLQQDQRYQMAQPMMAALAGPGAYGVGAFDPVLTNAAEMQAARPGESMLARAAQLGADNYEGFMAQAMLPVEQGGQGLSASAAQRLFWTEASAVEDDGTPTAAAQMLLDSLPQFPVEDEFGQLTGEYRPDRNAPLEFGQTLQTELLKDQDVQPIYEDAPAAEWFREQGLPLPTERYGEGNYSLEANIPGYEQSQIDFATQDQRLRNANVATRDLKAQKDAMTRRLLAEARQEGMDSLQTTVPYSAQQKVEPGYDIPIGGGITMDSGTQEMILGFGPDIPGYGPAGGSIQLNPPMESRRVEPKKEEGTGARARGRSKTPINAKRTQESYDLNRRYADAQTSKEAAKWERRRKYREVNSPDAVYMRNRNQALNQAGRTPTQDALMARQIALYLSGGYGPMG